MGYTSGIKWVCCECGKLMPIRELEGSLKHPYCKPCFKRVWDDDYKKFKNGTH